MLAKYGFVEDAPARGDGRERVWRATDRGWSVTTEPDDPPELRAAKDLLITTVYDEAQADLKRAMAMADRQAPEWRDATSWQRTLLMIAPEEMKELRSHIEDLIRPYRAQGREEAPDDARLAWSQFTLYLRPDRPAPGLPTEDHDAE